MAQWVSWINRVTYLCIHHSESEEHFTFVLTDLDSKYRFGFCLYRPKGDICMCIIRYCNTTTTVYLFSKYSTPATHRCFYVHFCSCAVSVFPPPPLSLSLFLSLSSLSLSLFQWFAVVQGVLQSPRQDIRIQTRHAGTVYTSTPHVYCCRNRWSRELGPSSKLKAAVLRCVSKNCRTITRGHA